MLQDDELVNRIKAGEKEAMEILVKRHYSSIYSYIYRKTGDKHIAYDLTQEVFIKMLQAVKSYSHQGKFPMWLMKIAVNQCYDYFRSKSYKAVSKQMELKDTLADHSSDIFEHVYERQEQIKAQQAVMELPQPQREAIILSYYHGLKIREIAQITETNESTIKSRLRHGIKKLKIRLEGEKSDEARQKNT